LRQQVQARVGEQKWDEAAVYMQATAEYAWRNHPGLFSDPELEDMLLRLAEEVPDGSGFHPKEPKAEPQTVLHVLTQAYENFGHTRLCSRWIEADEAHQHSVVLTSQGDHSVPGTLVDAVRDRAGTVVDLSAIQEPLLARAGDLRARAAGCDLIVLHIHPWDVVAASALASADLGPTLFVNHVDHAFWLGVRCADLFLQIRPAGEVLSARRRGVPEDRSAVLPIPLDGSVALERGREQVRRELGIGVEETMLLTAASPYKYEGAPEIGFLDTVLPALSTAGESKLVAVGPAKEGDWADAHSSTDGRVMPLGFRSDLDSLMAAADIYLDSFPLTSLTAVLEAGKARLPILRLGIDDPGMAAFRPDDIALDGHLVEAQDQPAFRRALLDLIEDPGVRERRGEETQKAVEANHVGRGWLRELGKVYAQAAPAAALPRLDASEPVEFQVESIDLALTDIALRSDGDTGFFRLLIAHCRLLPALPAVRMWFTFMVLARGDLRSVTPARVYRALSRWRRRRASSSGRDPR
jgi:hypothetical protein